MIPTNHATAKFSQLSLLTFSGDFNATVHSQNISDIQKLNYLMPCFKNGALLSMSDYDIAPENYIIRDLPTENYGKFFIMKKSLYSELH
ncbi:unnamed protein product [Brugia timori]|uniref:Uncharacterized protein n=1 Tax=Brugia timori TaxID=42155 RepID=A0A0R3R3T2_9BILA|nr:unnamed protein product [Brugia timori]